MSRSSSVLRHNAKKRLLQARLIHQCGAPSYLISSNRSPPQMPPPFTHTVFLYETRHSARDHVTPKSLKKTKKQKKKKKKKKKNKGQRPSFSNATKLETSTCKPFPFLIGEGIYKIDIFVASVLVQNFARYITSFVVTDLPLFLS